MGKPKLQNYRVCLFISVKNDELEYDNGILYFDTYSEDRLNAVMDVMKSIDLDTIKEKRAEYVRFDDKYSWHNAVSYNIIRVVDVLLNKYGDCIRLSA